MVGDITLFFMEIFLALLMIIGGLVAMTYGGNFLVDSSVSIAKKFKISEAVIGLTIVAIGTSIPELVVSILSALQGSGDLAIGNIIGTNTVNMLLVLGIAGVITPIVLAKSTRQFELPMGILTTLRLLLVVSDVVLDGATINMISRTDGIIFILFAMLFIAYSLKYNGSVVHHEDPHTDAILSIRRSVVYFFLGIGILFVGGNYLVEGAVNLAKMAGISESIIGLTIVAIGTSAPEMITAVLAARRGNPDIAVGNVIGSSILNVFVILGIASVIAPMEFHHNSFTDLFVSLGAILLVLILGSFGKNFPGQIRRPQAIFLIITYIAYLAFLILREMHIL